jgi:NIPSNAP
MKHKLLGLLILMAGFAFAQNRVYELRTYTCNEGKLEALKTRFRDHTIEIFKRHGMESIGYWIPQDPEKSKTTLIYILVHPSLDEAKKNWLAFRADPEWQKVSAASEANGKILAKSPESVFMDPADFSKLK